MFAITDFSHLLDVAYRTGSRATKVVSRVPSAGPRLVLKDIPPAERRELREFASTLMVFLGIVPWREYMTGVAPVSKGRQTTSQKAKI